MQTDLIVISEYCQNCHVDPSFIKMLESEGLISLQTIEDEKYIVASELRELEQYTRMYYDLSINIEGIDTIHHLLDRIKDMQREICDLKSRLQLFETEYFSPFDE